MNSVICVICSEPVDNTNANCSLLSPCCEKTWRHLKCSQNLEPLEKESYKCPACSIKTEFVERDYLSVEVSQKRDEFLENVSVECSAEECLCKDGRCGSFIDTQWEVLVCYVCKSLGTHKQCSDLPLNSNNWACKTCQLITVKLEDSVDIPCESSCDSASQKSHPFKVAKIEVIDDTLSSDNNEILKDETGTIDSLTSAPPQIHNTGDEYCVVKKPASDLKKRSHTNTGWRPNKCDYEGCDAAFQYISHLTVHQRIHTGERPCKCDYEGCDAAFTRVFDLTTHRFIHTGGKPYKCKYYGCKAAFNRAFDLKRHSTIHTAGKPYPCDYVGCDAAFRHLPTMRTHRLTHTGERPFKCDYKGCVAAFRHVFTMRTHRRTHTGEKPYKCDYGGCGALFRQATTLKRHGLTHTGEKPFKCDYNGCVAAFRQSAHLTTHYRTHRGGT